MLRPTYFFLKWLLLLAMVVPVVRAQGGGAASGIGRSHDRRNATLPSFDRLRELVQKSAAEIADAAQAFGQDDDITVLTLSRVGA